MGICCKLILFVFTTILAIQAYFIWRLFEVPSLPEIETEKWWGPGNPLDIPDLSIRPFNVSFNKNMTEKLIAKLNASDFYTEPVENAKFRYGFNGEYLQDVLEFWKKTYNFEGREKHINKYTHQLTNIQGLDIHYIHVKPKRSENLTVVPLLLLHGWPGTFLEFYNIIPYLTIPRPGRNYIFELIIPSLPGFGYSKATIKPGFGDVEAAVVLKNLMSRVGFDRFIVQGGDWGSAMGHHMSILFPENIIGFHTNLPLFFNNWSLFYYVVGMFYPRFMVAEEHEERLYPAAEFAQSLFEETGYFHYQATKPDTIGVALRDSPMGLAAYILEKFSTWTNPNYKAMKDGGLLKKYTMSELLDHVMVYWDSKSITTSMRLYKETVNNFRLQKNPIKVPTAISRNEHELIFMPEKIFGTKFVNLVQLTDNPGIGHFATMEAPDILSEDIWNAAGKFLEHHKKAHKSSEL